MTFPAKPRGRASETEDVVQRRFEVARREIEHYGFFDYLVVNDRLDVAFDDLRAVILAERCRRWRTAGLAELRGRTYDAVTSAK